jgi:hypothetical protein
MKRQQPPIKMLPSVNQPCLEIVAKWLPELMKSRWTTLGSDEDLTENSVNPKPNQSTSENREQAP